MLRSIFGEANLKLKRAFLFQLFVIFFVTVFCALGTWQLYRLQWKLELISEITFGLDSKPIEYSNSIKKMSVLGEHRMVLQTMTMISKIFHLIEVAQVVV